MWESIVAFFTKTRYTFAENAAQSLDVTILFVLQLVFPVVLFYILGKIIVALLKKKLPNAWELFGKSSFLIELFLRLFFIVSGVAIGLKIAGIDLSILKYFYSLFFKPFITISNSPVSIMSIVLLVIVISAAIFVSKYFIRFLQSDVYPKTSLEPGITNIINSFIKYLIITTGVIIGLQVNGIDLSVFAAIGAGLMVGIGFGLQNIASNFISGIVILLERPIKVGDYVEVDNIHGTIIQINARSTIIRTRENIEMIVPNSKFISENVVNWSHMSVETMLQVPIGISYTSDPEKARSVLLKIAEENEMVLADPPPEVMLDGFGDSSVNMSLEIWITEVRERFEIISSINFSIFKEFKKAGIRIPYPQMDVHVDYPDKK